MLRSWRALTKQCTDYELSAVGTNMSETLSCHDILWLQEVLFNRWHLSVLVVLEGGAGVKGCSHTVFGMLKRC